MSPTLSHADPRLPAALNELQSNGECKVDGDLARFGDWFAAVHEQIVERSR